MQDLTTFIYSYLKEWTSTFQYKCYHQPIPGLAYLAVSSFRHSSVCLYNFHCRRDDQEGANSTIYLHRHSIEQTRAFHRDLSLTSQLLSHIMSLNHHIMRPRSWRGWITVLYKALYSLANSELAIQAGESLSSSFPLGCGSEIQFPGPAQENGVTDFGHSPSRITPEQLTVEINGCSPNPRQHSGKLRARQSSCKADYSSATQGSSGQNNGAGTSVEDFLPAVEPTPSVLNPAQVNP